VQRAQFSPTTSGHCALLCSFHTLLPPSHFLPPFIAGAIFLFGLLFFSLDEGGAEATKTQNAQGRKRKTGFSSFFFYNFLGQRCMTGSGSISTSSPHLGRRFPPSCVPDPAKVPSSHHPPSLFCCSATETVNIPQKTRKTHPHSFIRYQPPGFPQILYLQ